MEKSKISGGLAKNAQEPSLDSFNAKNEFISSALSMSWRLAIAVIIPIVGGAKLDQHFNTSPLWILIGFVVAMSLSVLMIQQTLRKFSGNITKSGKKKIDMINTLASSGPIIHITALKLFSFHGITITNSMVYGWSAAVIMIIVLTTIARRMSIHPSKGFIQYIESGVEFITNLVESSFEDRERSYKYIPYFVTLFFFLLINNWLGLIPGVGEAFQIKGSPLLRPFTGDLNGTLAAGVVTMIYVYYSSIKEAGVKGYFSHFFVGSLRNPLYVVIGLIEMLQDLTRVISLSIRLFLNVTIGEIVIAVFSYLGGFLAPITATPFTLIELFVGALQAYIFTILSLMYLAIAVNHATEHANLTSDSIPETIGLQSEK